MEAIVLHLHKTRKEDDLTTIEIQVYAVGKLRKPKKSLLKNPIRFKPDGKNRGQRKIDLEMHKLDFPPEGLYVGIKWLKDENVKSIKVGPSLRLTMWENESLSYFRFVGHTNWFKHGFSDISGRIDVPMIDAVVLFPVKGK